MSSTYLFAICVSILLAFVLATGGPFDWMRIDNVDRVIALMDDVNEENCQSKPVSALRLPMATLSQLPQANQLLSSLIFSNRTNLVHLHNMALNRAFFFSYIMQYLNHSQEYYLQPGLRYFLYSIEADVAANLPVINGSGIFYDKNVSYPNWYQTVPFNKTVSLFGPRAFRAQDYNEPANWLREPTNNSFDITDYAAGFEKDYTDKRFKNAPWYDKFLPDIDSTQDSVRKYAYDVEKKEAIRPGEFVTGEYVGRTFFGPPAPGQQLQFAKPVEFTQPYFDCGNTNEWLVTAVAPVVDFLPRYLEWIHMRRFTFVAASTMDTYFLWIDINQCPLGKGNPAPNYFADTHKCEPLPGFGFHRGGYQCACLPGYRYPPYQRGPFQGLDIEMSTKEEYDYGYECEKVGLAKVRPIKGSDSGPTGASNVAGRRRKRSVAQKWFLDTFAPKQSEFKRKFSARRMQTPTPALPEQRLTVREAPPPEPSRKLHRMKRQQLPGWGEPSPSEAFDDEAFYRMEAILTQKDTITKENCASKPPDMLKLPGDVAYGVRKQFEPQGRTALRLANFLSNYLQTINPIENFGILRNDKRLNTAQLFAEVVANVMADNRILGSGIFFDTNKYAGAKGPTASQIDQRELFGPYAFRKKVGSSTGTISETTKTKYSAVDFAGFKEEYVNEPWFQSMKYRWGANTYGLQRYLTRAMIKDSEKGLQLMRFEHYPMYYYAAEYDDGEWLAPVFKCDERVNDWVVTYVVPFFGKNEVANSLEFKGVVTVDVDLSYLDINQCPMDFFTPNAFKGTARCDYPTTYCVPLEGRRFRKGGYKCECLQGYEYPFLDDAWYYDGQTMEKEYQKTVQGLENRFLTLKCRLAGASAIHASWLLAALCGIVLQVLA